MNGRRGKPGQAEGGRRERLKRFGVALHKSRLDTAVSAIRSM